ncbi:polysaccharide deacetylase family protein [Flavobacterium sp. I3-2]|uniref:polysaccharide deacetylase family protein n=1 Tax=Flavobacterium sp. I3-2 TaxID=2748319 RepID=UPI0015A7C6DF|nr:polysaccharide deacetylase family protein [Flavobacterium sp. I3-2]
MQAKIPSIIKTIFYNQIWNIPNDEKKIFLTFDDGPIPEVTPWVLSVLKQYNIKATFFCIGDNVRKYPEVFKQIVAEGHQVANHSFNHLNGWKTKTKDYIENVLETENEILKHTNLSIKLFRPPYGKIKPKQSYKLRKLGFKIIMWDVLSIDYDLNLLPENCEQNVMQHVTSGSIIIFHDSIKASKNLSGSLSSVIEKLLKSGYSFETIN